MLLFKKKNYLSMYMLLVKIFYLNNVTCFFIFFKKMTTKLEET
jgi:hypothetical protein